MLIPVLLLSGAGFGCWPPVTAPDRLRRCGLTAVSSGAPKSRAVGRRKLWSSLIVAVAVGGYALLGIFGAAGCCLLLFAVRQHWLERRRMTLAFDAGRQFAAGVHALVMELRAGTHPAIAAEAAAAETDVATAQALRAIAATQRLGGSCDVVTMPESRGGVGSARSQLGHAWELAHRHGLPLADVLAALQQDVANRVRFASDVHAGMSGVRASATVLALLPAVGLVFGTVLGADPATVLTATSTGQLLLAAGCALLAAGLFWSSRLTRNGVSI